MLRCAGAGVLAVPVGFQLVNCVSQTCILTPLPLTLVSSVLRVLVFLLGVLLECPSSESLDVWRI